MRERLKLVILAEAWLGQRSHVCRMSTFWPLGNLLMSSRRQYSRPLEADMINGNGIKLSGPRPRPPPRTGGIGQREASRLTGMYCTTGVRNRDSRQRKEFIADCSVKGGGWHLHVSHPLEEHVRRDRMSQAR